MERQLSLTFKGIQFMMALEYGQLFFKAALRCQWCSNPRTSCTPYRLDLLQRLCKLCGRCFNACPHNAIIPGQGVYRINQEKCNACGLCVQACYYGALVLW